MADGGLKIELDPVLSERLRSAAEAAGESAQDFVSRALRAALDADWAEDYARVAKYEATGRSITAEAFVSELREAIEARFSKE